MTRPVRKVFEAEPVDCNDWIAGVIDKVEIEHEHEFIYKGEKAVRPAIRLHFVLEGYEFKKYSKWMTFSYGGKATLYKTYIASLVKDARPDMDFDIEVLNGMAVKVMFKENVSGEKTYYNIESIRPLKEKLAVKENSNDGEAVPI